MKTLRALCAAGLLGLGGLAAAAAVTPTAGLEAEIRTPPAPETPRINGPAVFGVRPGAPLLYTIPATGRRPMAFRAAGLPKGLKLDAATGRISGTLALAGRHAVTLTAKNALGQADRVFTLVCGDAIALTPAMGWNSWNCWAWAVDQDKVLRSAKALVAAGLDRHGWNYVNIDDTWQGKRDPKTLALQPNERFADMAKLCRQIHGLGLKVGIYSSPWITTFSGYPGDSSDDPQGAWQRLDKYDENKRLGKHSFAAQDAAQFAAWGMDYLKYDWAPNDIEHTRLMAEALRATGRDIVFSLSCAASLDNVEGYKRWANSWRTTGDMWDTWDEPGPWQYSVSEIGFSQDAWTSHGGPGHFNDPDMLVVGVVGWGKDQHPTRLTPAEQYSHVTLWCLLGSPLLIGCDLEKLDAFTLNLLTNDEVIAVDQDELASQGRRVATIGAVDVYKKDLADGSAAFGFFNRGDVEHTVTAKLDRLGAGGKRTVRDLWRQRDLPVAEGDLKVTVGPHDAQLYKIAAANATN